MLHNNIGNTAYEAIDTFDPKADVRYSTVPTRVEQDSAGVGVWLKDSSDGTESREHYNLLVGANSVHSTVRKLIFGPDEKYIHHLGYMIVASQIPEDLPKLERGQGVTFAEAGRSLWVFPFKDCPATVMFSYKADDVAAEFTAASPAARIREVYGPRTAPQVKTAVDQLKRVNESLFDGTVQVQTDWWHKGRVVLMGGAGWRLTLHSWMGASTVLASADLLTTIIGRKKGDVGGALGGWETRSRPFIRHYQKVGACNRAFFTSAGRADGTAWALAMPVFKRPWGCSLLASFIGAGRKGNRLMKSVIPAWGRVSPSRPREWPGLLTFSAPDRSFRLSILGFRSVGVGHPAKGMAKFIENRTIFVLPASMAESSVELWAPGPFSSACIGAVCVTAVLVLVGCRGSDADSSSAGLGQSSSPGVSTSPSAHAGISGHRVGKARPTMASSGRRSIPSPSDDFTRAAVKPEEPRLSNPFDSLCDQDSGLAALSVNPADTAGRPAVADDLKKSAAPDPVNKALVCRATDVSKAEGSFVRHDNPHKQAFNAGNTRFIARNGQDAWCLYDTTTSKRIKKLGEFKGNYGPIWHASNPNLLHFILRDGGTTWWTYNVETEKSEVISDSSGRTPRSQATSFSTKGRSIASADGRYLTLIATRHDETTRTRNIYGLVVLSVKGKRVVGVLNAKNLPRPGASPDCVSASPSGKHVVISWPGNAGGTHVYTRNLADSFELPTTSKHTDMAYGPQEQDYYIFADYSKNQLSAIDLDSHERIDLRNLYPANGENCTLDISGQTYSRPGWAVVSTYGEKKDDVSDEAALQERAKYRRVQLVELKAGGQVLSVADARTNASAIGGSSKDTAPQTVSDPDFFKPQASASWDLSRIVFADSFGQGLIESCMIDLPS